MNVVACPDCASTEIKVIDSRTKPWERALPVNLQALVVKHPSRNRRCLSCGHTWPTHEISRDDLLSLVDTARVELAAEVLARLAGHDVRRVVDIALSMVVKEAAE